ncbi:hypothetical protein [Ideonella sp. YS5]|uniref:hypothetical protein n=1 Tax=Ideonella sp. YS5 TaxID=3453714 RepID=UPI003EEC322B
MNGTDLFDGGLLFAALLFVPAFAFWLFLGNNKVNGRKGSQSAGGGDGSSPGVDGCGGAGCGGGDGGH